jgi:hypothetical protein
LGLEEWIWPAFAIPFRNPAVANEESGLESWLGSPAGAKTGGKGDDPFPLILKSEPFPEGSFRYALCALRHTLLVLRNLHQISIRIFAEEEVGPIISLAGTFHDGDAVCFQLFHGFGKIFYLQSRVAHRPGDGFIVHHQMELGGRPNLIPVTGKAERGPEYRLQPQDFSIKVLALFQITDDDTDVVVIFYLDHLEILLKILLYFLAVETIQEMLLRFLP